MLALATIIAGAFANACSVTGSGPADLPTGAAVRIEGPKCAGLTGVEGSGVAVGPDLVATVAHTFDGISEFHVIDAEGRMIDGSVVYFDPATDLAFVRTESTLPRSLDLHPAMEGGTGYVLSAAEPGDITVKPTRVLRQLTVTLDGEGARDGLEIEAEIGSGDSGAAVIDEQRRVIGLVFASSDPPGRGWALAASELQAGLERIGEPIELACG